MWYVSILYSDFLPHCIHHSFSGCVVGPCFAFTLLFMVHVYNHIQLQYYGVYFQPINHFRSSIQLFKAINRLLNVPEKSLKVVCLSYETPTHHVCRSAAAEESNGGGH